MCSNTVKVENLHSTATTSSCLRKRVTVCISTYHHCTSITSSKGNIGGMFQPVSVNKYIFKLKQFTILHIDIVDKQLLEQLGVTGCTCGLTFTSMTFSTFTLLFLRCSNKQWLM